jgi:hypothetical protein
MGGESCDSPVAKVPFYHFLQTAVTYAVTKARSVTCAGELLTVGINKEVTDITPKNNPTTRLQGDLICNMPYTMAHIAAKQLI